ncbi:unnamed protein product [Amoebophrya sp. A120]|nr:unnamed protein product [Amoebophrya sp. A120]|eukprot:GSA120T00008552001.1
MTLAQPLASKTLGRAALATSAVPCSIDALTERRILANLLNKDAPRPVLPCDFATCSTWEPSVLRERAARRSPSSVALLRIVARRPRCASGSVGVPPATPAGRLARQ